VSAQQSTEAVRRQFGAVASAYATSSVHTSGPDLAALVAEAALTGAERVLDMGCGAGHTALALAPRAESVTAIDVTPEMVEVARDLARQRGLQNVTVEVADVAALALESRSFDLVTSRLSAHHYADPTRALAEAARVLRPGGRLLLIDTVSPEDAALDTFFNAFEFLRDPSHVRNWRASEWVRMAANAGFAAEVIGRFAFSLDANAWVARSQTPPEKVSILRRLFSEATPAQRAAFELHDSPWSLSVPVALLRASLRQHFTGEHPSRSVQACSDPFASPASAGSRSKSTLRGS
jgi:ubiquinone/menaquinone biosynthesis C-methylase UbiE